MKGFFVVVFVFLLGIEDNCDWRCSSRVKHVLSICEALSLVPCKPHSPQKKKTKTIVKVNANKTILLHFR
jgi:hypothetical protein